MRRVKRTHEQQNAAVAPAQPKRTRHELQAQLQRPSISDGSKSSRARRRGQQQMQEEAEQEPFGTSQVVQLLDDGDGPTSSAAVAAAAASALSVSSAASSSLESFDCWRHLVQAYSGPGPLCILFEEEEEANEAEEEEEEQRVKVLAPCYLKFLDDQWRDVPAPRGFFARPSGGAGAGARGLARKHPLHALQHLMHAVLYHRDFDTPLEHAGVRLFSARRPAAEAEGRLFRALAAQHDTRLLEDDVDGLGSCGYFLFGVQLTQPFTFHPSFVVPAPSTAQAVQDVTADTASASNALGAGMRRRGRGRPRRQKGGEAEEEEDNEALVDLTTDAAASAPPAPQTSTQQRQRRQQQSKPDVLRRTVQRRVKH